MAVEQKKVVFSFDDMIASLRRAMKTFPDLRTGKNKTYELMDAASGAFSVFFTQCPSFLSHQKLMQQKYGLSNSKTLFGMRDIPTDNHIRMLLDPVSPSLLGPVFEGCFDAFSTSGHLNSFRVSLGKEHDDLLIALDGTEYHTSDTISCDNCSVRVKDHYTRYLHSMITPTLVKPNNNTVISLPAEFIIPQDGNEKQDCEQNAAKRWIKNHKKRYASENVTILGDDLYAHEPMCREFLSAGFNFILVAKPESHKTLYEWCEGIMQEKVIDRFDGKKHLIYTYRYVEQVPLRNDKDALLVNFVEVTVTERKSAKQLYHNEFVTNHPLTDETLPVIIDCGRARWKIENENNNTLKTKGYHLEHNFGHGKQFLSSLLAAMNLLAFLFHTMLEFMNKKYKLLRTALWARKRFFNDIRTLLVYLPFKSFDTLMTFMLEGIKQPYGLETLKVPV